jgi:uncharacterized protein YecE (DUF72 family)
LADAQTTRLKPNLHVGTMGWSYNFWKTEFYPKELPSKEFLGYYAKTFDTVEVDNTFYRIPRAQTITEWSNQTPEGFLFSLKFPQKITHIKMLVDCEEETKVFLERVSLLKKKLGVLLLQFSPSFGQKHMEQLRDYLNTLPEGMRYAVEVRNKSLLSRELFSLLKERNVSLVWVDSAKMPLIQESTADFAFLRWEGDRKSVNGTLGKREKDKTNEIQKWANRIRTMLVDGRQVFGYFSKYYSGLPPCDAEELIKILC